MEKDEDLNMKDEWSMMKDEGFKLLRGFDDEQTDIQTDICGYGVAFTTEKSKIYLVIVSRVLLGCYRLFQLEAISSRFLKLSITFEKNNYSLAWIKSLNQK